MNIVECSELTDVVWVDPERMGGMACFRGTRVPVETLFTWLSNGHDLEDILENFPSVTKEQAVALLKWAMMKTVGESGALETLTR